jgi:hypothetical protein
MLNMRIRSVAIAVLMLAPTGAAGAEIDLDTCRVLVPHSPRADVTHQPGRGVGGRAVAPADLDRRDPALPDRFAIDVSVLLGDRYGRPSRRELDRAELRAGRVEVDVDGRAWFNGRRLDAEDRDRLIVVCRDVLELPRGR